MAFVQWRRFDFFVHNFLDKKKNDRQSADRNISIDNQKNDGNLDTFAKLKKIKITCSDSGRGHIVLGDENGWIHKLDNDLEMDSFQAFDLEVITVQLITQNPYLLTSGVDEQSMGNTIKVFNQDRIDPHKQMPTCVRVIKNNVFMGASPTNARITCLRATDALTFMVIGYNDGNVVLVKCDILKDKSFKHRKFELCKDAITGVFLKGNYRTETNNFLSSRLLALNPTKQKTKQVSSFITTNSRVYSLEMNNDQESWNLIENDFGCTNGRYCCLINDGKHLDNCMFILGRKDAIYFYQSDGRGPCLAFDNEKLILHWFKDYLIVVSKEILPYSATLADSVVSIDDKNQLTIYDIRNKYIAFSATFSSINQIFAEWGYLFVLLTDGRLVRIREKDMNSKLEVLFKKQQYSLAIELAKNQNFNSDNLTDIFKEYADHLYKQGDFEAAINQYVKTIGKLEPSYVIRRYLDGQKIKHLTSYLLNLHRKGLTNKDHTSLYLNCLTKSEKADELISFLKKFNYEQSMQNNKFKDQHLDVQNAIAVLRDLKLYDQALHLCEIFKCYDLYFEIEIENKGNYIGAIEFIQTKLLKEKDLFFDRYFVKYSKVLFHQKPAETTELLKRICEKNLKSNRSTDQDKKNENLFYIDILMSKPEKLIEFLEFLKEKNPDFKESTISNTLLELYLQNYRESLDDAVVKAQLAAKISDFLQDHTMKYDDERAMILCQVNQFDQGLKYLYEKLKMYDILMFQCIESRNDDQIIDVCEEHGNRDANLWIQAFFYFCKLNNTDNTRREAYLLRTIDEITRQKLLPLVSVINHLSLNQTINLQMVKNYLINSFAKENETITENESLIKQHKDESDRISKQIESIEFHGKVFQSNKCAICNTALDLPALHFFCSHSFHLHCHQSHCGENDNDCCLCLPEQKKVLQIAELSQTSNNNELQEKFLKSVHKPDSDSFTSVANFFSKKIFD